MNPDDEENGYFSWPIFRFRLLKAVCDEDISSIQSMLSEVDVEDQVDIRQLVYSKCESSRKALEIRNLDIVQILFPIHGMVVGCKLKEEVSRDLVCAAIKLDYVEGLQYLLSKGLVLDIDFKHSEAFEQSTGCGQREVLRYLLSTGEINVSQKLLVLAYAIGKSERRC